jgi:hypothetical protein
MQLQAICFSHFWQFENLQNHFIFKKYIFDFTNHESKKGCFQLLHNQAPFADACPG